MSNELIPAYKDELPNGWEAATVSDLIHSEGVFKDGDWVESKDQDPNGDVRLIQLADIGDGEYKNKSARFLTKEKAIELNCTFLQKGDVLVARMPDPLGRACIFPGDDKEAVTVVDVCVIRTGHEDVNHKWFMYWVNSPSFRNTIASLQSGTTRKRISRKNLAKISFPLAPPEQQKRIVAKIEELFSHIDAGIEALKKAKQLLKQYRQSVLKAAVTGELTKDLPCRQAGWHDISFRNISDKLVPEESEAYFAYVLECEDSSLYKGFTQDLFVRINHHLEGRGAKWTLEHKPVALIYFEEFTSEKEAVAREKYFKSGSGREWLNDLKNQQNKKHEPASQLLERILKERRQKWEEQQLEQFKTKGKMPKDGKWREKYKNLALPSTNSLPEIPASWQWVELQHVFDVITDGDHQAPPKAEEGIPFLVIGDVNKGVINFEDKRFVPGSYYDGLAEIRRPRKGDLLYTVVGSFGIPVKVESDKEFCVQRHIAILKPSSQMAVNYLYHILSSGFVFKQAADVSTGTAQKTVPLGGLRELKIPLPPYEEQVVIENLIDSKLDAVFRTDKESTNKILMAEQNKQSILASSFSGKLQG